MQVQLQVHPQTINEPQGNGRPRSSVESLNAHDVF